MRVFNLTDIATPVLEQHKLVDQHIAVARRMVNPGEYADIGDAPNALHDLQFLLQVGAVSIDRVPPAYAVARQTRQEAIQTRLSGIPVRHVDMKETAIQGVTAQGQQVVPVTEPLPRFDPTKAVDEPCLLVPSSTEPSVPEKSKSGKKKGRR